ncbi:MAG: hypothetical protein KH575_03955, partial [Enterobacter sp.]|uniref:hypothetical protein n=1 Tax=Enterobacter sp. TaxID=42895 RepID=UPI002587397A
SPRPTGNASAIYSRTEASLKAFSYSEGNVIASVLKLLGNPLPVGEGQGEGISPHETAEITYS